MIKLKFVAVKKKFLIDRIKYPNLIYNYILTFFRRVYGKERKRLLWYG